MKILSKFWHILLDITKLIIKGRNKIGRRWKTFENIIIGGRIIRYLRATKNTDPNKYG